MRKTQRAPERGVNSKTDREVAADLQLLTPPAAISFPSCRKRYGRKGALGYVWAHPASEFRRAPIFQASFHSKLTLRASWYAPPDTGVSGLQLVALEQLLSIEGTLEILMNVSFLRAPTTYNAKLCRKKVQPDKPRLHLLLTASIQRQPVTNPIPPYQAARSKKLVR